MKKIFTMLAALALVAGVSAGDNKEKGKFEGREGMGHERGRIMKELNLTEAQKEKMKASRGEMQKARIQLESDIKIAQIDLKTALEKYPEDKAGLAKAMDRLKELEGKKIQQRVEHLTAFVDLLTPEQRVKAKGMLEMPPFGEGRMERGPDRERGRDREPDRK